MIILSKEQIKITLPKIKNGLVQYLWIQNELSKRDVSKDEEFQKKFNYFYKITPHRDKNWQKDYYNLLQKNKKVSVSFEKILSNLYKKTGKLEASFASTLKATISPDMHIIDSVVLKHLKLKLPYSYQKNRSFKINEIYQILISETSEFLKTEKGKYLIEQFIKEYPEANITKTKMLDLVLWQTRD